MDTDQLTPGIKKVLRIFGSQSAFARSMNVSRGVVNKWVIAGYIPCNRIWQVLSILKNQKTYAGENVSAEELLEEEYVKRSERLKVRDI